MRVYQNDLQNALLCEGVIYETVNKSKTTVIGLNYFQWQLSIPAKDGKNKLLMNQNYEIR